MLSVQTPGCAGMERLGVPTRTSISATPREERNRRTRHEHLVNCDTQILTSQSTNILNNQQNVRCNLDEESSTKNVFISSTSTSVELRTKRCPHHIPLPDGEWGDDRNLQIRTPSQQSEIPRTYTIAPPNKSVCDVPGNYRLGNSSTSVINLHEHFGSGRSIANVSSTSAPVSKTEKSKHKILSNLTSLFKTSVNKSPESSCQQQNQLKLNQSSSAMLSNNNSNTLIVTAPVSSFSPSVSPTFTNNPPLDSRISCFTPSASSGTNLINNFSSDLSPSTSQLSVVAATCLNRRLDRSFSPSTLSSDDYSYCDVNTTLANQEQSEAPFSSSSNLPSSKDNSSEM